MTTESRACTVILKNEKSGGFSAYCHALPGCVSQGDDWANVMLNIKEATSLIRNVLDDGAAGRDVAVRKSQDPKSSPPYPETPALIAEEMRVILVDREKDGPPLDGVSIECVDLSDRTRV